MTLSAFRPWPGLVVGVLVAASSVGASAQWKWRDAVGQLHASDLPPPHEVPEKDILQRPTPPRSALASTAAASAASAAAAPTKSPLEIEVEARRARALQEAAAEKARRQSAEAQASLMRADNCERARQQLAALDSGQRLARFNAKGEREVIDDKTRADEVARARNVIASDCKS